jgi:hypothetical protein
MTDKAKAEASLRDLQSRLDAANLTNAQLQEKLQKVGDPTSLFTDLLVLVNKNKSGFNETEAQKQLAKAHDANKFVYREIQTAVELLTQRVNSLTTQSNNNYDAIGARELAKYVCRGL